MLSIISSVDKLQAALDKLAGLTAPDPAQAPTEAHRPRYQAVSRAYESAPAFGGLMEAYREFGGDLESFGRVREDFRATEEITSTTFALSLGNTLSRRMIADYQQPDYGEDLIISLKKPVPNFKLQEANIIGYFGDLSDVDPETGDYQDIVPPTEFESTYTPGQKGNLLTFTRRSMLNDDIGILRRMPLRLGRAARRTHARYVWSFFINNTNFGGDGVAIFHANHGNLGSTALGVGAVQALIAAMRKQTEPSSGERITFGGPFHLFVPSDLEFAAKFFTLGRPLNQAAETTPFDTTLVGIVIPHVNPLFTDTNDYLVTAPVAECELIEMGYIGGNEQPELFLADQPTVGQMFVGDKLQYKIRHEYGGTCVDYRGAQKAVVAGG